MRSSERRAELMSVTSESTCRLSTRSSVHTPKFAMAPMPNVPMTPARWASSCGLSIRAPREIVEDGALVVLVGGRADRGGPAGRHEVVDDQQQDRADDGGDPAAQPAAGVEPQLRADPPAD